FGPSVMHRVMSSFLLSLLARSPDCLVDVFAVAPVRLAVLFARPALAIPSDVAAYSYPTYGWRDARVLKSRSRCYPTGAPRTSIRDGPLSAFRAAPNRSPSE